MLSVAEALERIVAQGRLAPRLGVAESVDLSSAVGRVLAADVFSPIAVPPWDNSAMDGFALRAEDLASTDCFTVSQYVAAGDAPGALQSGTAARVFTGAPVPEGANAVVMQENTQLDNNRVRILQSVAPGENVRPKGQDIQQGVQLLAKGRRLTAADVGVIASVGAATVAVRPALKVAVLTTGNELVEPGGELAAGQIYNSNRFALQALLEQMGIEVEVFRPVADDLDATIEAFAQAAQCADCVLSCGGVSVGDADYVKPAVEVLGALDLWRLAIKPGKPLAFGHINGCPFFGLPGNPVSVFVTFLIVVRPYLQLLQGRSVEPLLSVRARADFSWPKPGGRQEYLRAQLVEGGEGLSVDIHPVQSSGALLPVSWANALVVLKPGQVVEPDDNVDVLVLSSAY